MATKNYSNEHPKYKEKAAKDRKKRHQKDYESYEKWDDWLKQSSPEGNPFGHSKGYTEQGDNFRTMQKERFMYGEHKYPNVFKKIGSDIKKLYKNIKQKKKK